MVELKALYETLNFKNVRTYIQSGNVIFEYKQIDPQKLSKQIEQIIAQKYHFEVSVIIKEEEVKSLTVSVRQENISEIFVALSSICVIISSSIPTV